MRIKRKEETIQTKEQTIQTSHNNMVRSKIPVANMMENITGRTAWIIQMVIEETKTIIARRALTRMTRARAKTRTKK